MSNHNHIQRGEHKGLRLAGIWLITVSLLLQLSAGLIPGILKNPDFLQITSNHARGVKHEGKKPVAGKESSAFVGLEDEEERLQKKKQGSVYFIFGDALEKYALAASGTSTPKTTANFTGPQHIPLYLLHHSWKFHLYPVQV